MIITTTTRAELKLACLALLDEVAVQHPAGHQGKLAARYVLQSASGKRIGLMFEKSVTTPANLWLEQRFATDLMEAELQPRVYLASDLYSETEPGQKPLYGRHTGLKPMRELANADLVRVTFDRIAQLEMIITRLRTL